MVMEVSKIDVEANKQGIEAKLRYYSKETIIFLLNFENQLKNSNPVLEYRFYTLITIPVVGQYLLPGLSSDLNLNKPHWNSLLKLLEYLK